MDYLRISSFQCAAALAVLTGAALTLPAQAQELGYYTGVYEVVGKDASKTPKFLNFMARLEPMGEGLAVQMCGKPDGYIEFEEGDFGDFLLASFAGLTLYCSVYNNADNFAHLACRGEDGELLTLWPVMEASDTQLVCD